MFLSSGLEKQQPRLGRGGPLLESHRLMRWGGSVSGKLRAHARCSVGHHTPEQRQASSWMRSFPSSECFQPGYFHSGT